MPTTTMKTMRTKPAPCLRASRVPSRLPATLVSAITAATCHQMWPWLTNNASANALVTRFISLAVAEARRKS